MSRSSKKGPYINEKLLKKVAKVKPGDKTIIKTWSRDSFIAPEMVGLTFGVYNGKDFINVIVAEDMVGHRLGEFSLTRKFVNTGINADEKVPKTKTSKIVSGRRKAAKKSDSWGAVKKCAKILCLTSPKTREKTTITMMIVAADNTLDWGALKILRLFAIILFTMLY